MCKLKNIIILLFTLLGFSSWATNTGFAVWLPLTINWSTQNYLYEFQPQIRLLEGGGDIDQTLINFGIGRKMNSWSPWLGVAYSHNALDAQRFTHEFRLWEQFLWSHQYSKINLQSRLRLENRKAEGFSEISNRLRERLMIQKDLKNKATFILSNELFINFNRVPWVSTNFFDQNRIYIGFAKNYFIWEQKVQFGIGYMNQYVFSVPTNVSEQILMLSANVIL